ncbi:MAG: class I SAM-dependent methyltransferase [Vicinamibacterales bacterium]
MTPAQATRHRERAGWDNPAIARYYERFCARHGRYQEANAALVREADLKPGQRVLDLGAGTGRTAEAALPFLGPQGTIVCVEPSSPMRVVGKARLPDDRVRWSPDCRGETVAFDRILCGASIWQMTPLDRTFQWLANLLSPGGALCFNIPSLYLGEPDEPGGGRDPLLLELAGLLSRGHHAAAAGTPLPDADQIARRLSRAGLQPRRWTFRVRLTQAAYRDWLKLPVVTDWMLGGVDADDRARQIDEAFSRIDRESWRWERWTGWTAQAARQEGSDDL